MKPRAFKRIWGKPWDFTYLLLLEYAKIKEMRDFIKKHGSHEDHTQVVRDMSICLKLIDIILERDSLRYDVDTGKNRTYINTRNGLRFGNTWESYVFNNNPSGELLKDCLRISKAIHLYNKIRTYRILSWWD